MTSRGPLWKHADFLRLWAAQAVSAFGSRITRTALPIIAITTLHQPESIVGVLVAGQLAPGVLLALFVGGFIDRGNKRRILIVADLVRAVAVASLTVAAVFGVLGMAHLLVVGAVVGAATAMFMITDTAYLPSLISKDQLAEGNAKLETTEAIAEIGGPASGGALIAMLGAPLAVAVDAATYVWSALMLGRIRARREAPQVALRSPLPPTSDVPPNASPPEPATPSRELKRGDLEVGMRAVFGHPIVRLIVISHMFWSLSGGFFMALYTPFCLRVLHLDTTWLGIVISMGGIGALAGALLSRVFVRSLGLGNTIVLASTLSLACALFIPLATGPFWLVIAMLIAHQLLSDGFSVAFVIQAVTLRQTVLPKALLGRANAAIHVCTGALLPIGALLSGLLAEALGTRNAVWIGVAIGLVPPLILLPLRKLREMPPPA